jgi:hypothetical protein
MFLDDDFEVTLKMNYHSSVADDVSTLISDSSYRLYEDIDQIDLGMKRKTSILDILHKKSISFD